MTRQVAHLAEVHAHERRFFGSHRVERVMKRPAETNGDGHSLFYMQVRTEDTSKVRADISTNSLSRCQQERQTIRIAFRTDHGCASC